MCFDPSARPPQAPRSGALAGSERLTLTAADGNVVAARLARTSDGGAPGVVILPDVRGLHGYYEALAEEFAGAGVQAVAIDFYGRSAGAHYRGDDFDYALHRAVTKDQHVLADVRAAMGALAGAGATDVYALGFCFGGRAAFMQASQPGIAGVVGFYGWPTRVEETGSSPVQEAKAGRVKASVLALYGGADEGIGQADINAYNEALAGAGANYQTVVYPGAPHSFFDRKMSEHADACKDAWVRVLDLMGVPA